MTTHAIITRTSVLESLNRHGRRREKVFGDGKPRPMSRNIKLRLTALARAKMRPTEPGKHYGEISAKHFAVLQALLWGFHNAITGLCFPSYEAIAGKAGCARSTVHEAIKALEAAGLLTWLHRLKRVREVVRDLFGDGAHGQRSRVLRTSNGYQFIEPPDVKASSSELKSGTEGQESFSLPIAPPLPPQPMDSALEAALARLGRAISDRR
jgi:DNA-binding MarR family transcriptional regulator